MPAIFKSQLSLEDLAQVISSLNLEEKLRLQQMIEQQIFERLVLSFPNPLTLRLGKDSTAILEVRCL
ncbi:hypothetical protein CLI64_00955 [Nostoc sp. CENA543]|uniref:hypothetical protein n=1 Tax=Nostoc sp. CENA543 TaxID=1869241 RepID=UPI000CA38F9B|nr:hypothetical protein [Nostoc sp. CENA543]AUS99082.1 hypothetical protein CLI64_00955 [Nostoc sp. CENA543]